VKWHVIAHHRQPTTVPAQNVDGKLNVAVIISMCRMMPISLDTVPLTTTTQLVIACFLSFQWWDWYCLVRSDMCD